MSEPPSDSAAGLSGHVFISYAGPDAGLAAALAAAIEQAGARAWIDARDAMCGDRWDEVIPAALQAASRVAVLVTPSWGTSWYAPEEVARAIAFARQHGLKRHIVPVLHGEIDPQRLPYGLFNLVPIRVKGGDWLAAGRLLASPTRLPLLPLRTRLAHRRWPLILAAVGLAIAGIVWSLRDRAISWPGPEAVEVSLDGATLRVDVREAIVSDLGTCMAPEPPEGQRRWCEALGGIIDPTSITPAVVEGRGDVGARFVVGLDPATAEAICALRGMRLPTDAEFMALAALGEPSWPEPLTIAGVIDADVRGAQRLRGLSTAAVEWVRFGGGYLGRGTPMLSGDAVANIAAHRDKLLGDLTRPEKREPSAVRTDFGFRCVAEVP